MGVERRRHQRAPLQQLCELEFPALMLPIKATVLDVSAGGMRLRIPRIQAHHFATAFLVRWSIGSSAIATQVARLRSYSEHEIAVTFLAPGARLTGEITRCVYATLRTQQQLNRLKEPGTPEEGPEHRARSSRNVSQEAHQSRLTYWINRRVATHLDPA